MDALSFSHLVAGTGISDDTRQQFYLEVLRASSLTEAEAYDLLSRVKGQLAYSERKHRPMSLLVEIDPPEPQPDNGPMIKALDLLPHPEQELVRSHVLDGNSLRAIARASGVDEKTIRKRYRIAKQKLADLCTKGPQ